MRSVEKKQSKWPQQLQEKKFRSLWYQSLWATSRTEWQKAKLWIFSRRLESRFQLRIFGKSQRSWIDVLTNKQKENSKTFKKHSPTNYRNYRRRQIWHRKKRILVYCHHEIRRNYFHFNSKQKRTQQVIEPDRTVHHRKNAEIYQRKSNQLIRYLSWSKWCSVQTRQKLHQFRRNKTCQSKGCLTYGKNLGKKITELLDKSGTSAELALNISHFNISGIKKLAETFDDNSSSSTQQMSTQLKQRVDSLLRDQALFDKPKYEISIAKQGQAENKSEYERAIDEFEIKNQNSEEIKEILSSLLLSNALSVTFLQTQESSQSSTWKIQRLFKFARSSSLQRIWKRMRAIKSWKH